nr:hypothetical protein [uncultured Campylobacter sp.]
MKKFLFAAVMLFSAAFANDLQSENLASLKAQCQSGDAAKCAVLGDAYYEEYIASGDEEARKLSAAAFKEACDKGDGEGCAGLGLSYIDEGDAAASEKLLEKTCDELKTATACYNLGFFKIDGHGGFKQDVKGAMKYYEKACDLGYAAGCEELGGIYNVGEADVKADENKALKYYEKSCALGSRDGCDAVKLIKGGK